MRSAVFFAALVTAVSAQLRIETPTSLIECQPAKLMWTGGTAPYYPAVIPGGQASAAALKTFPQTSDTTITWNVDLAAGQQVTLRITDAQGNVNYAEQVPIQAGSNKACLTAAGGAASAGSASSAAAAPSAAVASGASSVSRAAASSAAGAAAPVASAASSASSAVGGAASGVRSAASSASGAVSAAAASASGAVSGTRAPATASSTAAAYLGAEPKMIGGLLGVVASVFGVLAM